MKKKKKDEDEEEDAPSNSDQTSNLEWRCSFFLQNVNQIDMFFCYGQSTKIHFKSLSSTFKENDYFGSNTCLNVAHPILYLSTLTSFVNIKNGRNLCNHYINTEKKTLLLLMQQTENYYLITCPRNPYFTKILLKI